LDEGNADILADTPEGHEKFMNIFISNEKKSLDKWKATNRMIKR
jgi:hypothetical protein